MLGVPIFGNLPASGDQADNPPIGRPEAVYA